MSIWAFIDTCSLTSSPGLTQRRNESRAQMKQISSFLRVDHRPDAILLAINEKQHEGSCQWLTSDEAFQEWVDGLDVREQQHIDDPLAMPSNPNYRVLWLTGRPGTGKSVAAGHVVRYLKSCNLDCNFYFFRHDDTSGSTISALLHSLAFQMAESSDEVRQAIVSMIEDGAGISPNNDHHMLWNELFAGRIFKLESLKPQFWVIDAVDECPGNEMPALVAMLSELDPTVPLRVFMTSRPGGQLETLLRQTNLPFAELSTGREGSLRDIERFLQAKCPQIQDPESHQSFLSDLLVQSNGIFLWVSLMVERLEDIYSVEDVREVLREVPSEMDELYSRITESILASPDRDVARCLLKWVVCSPRPLAIGELTEAVKLETSVTLAASPGQLEATTGHLVFVESESRVYIAHQTAESFLTRRRDGLWIDRSAAHSSIAEVCLTVLGGTEFAPPRTHRGAGSSRARKSLSPLASYAAINFGYHLMHSSSAVDSKSLLAQLSKFLRSNNALTWIERLAESGDLSILQQTAHRLEGYLAQRAKDQQLESEEVQTVTAWVTDIRRLVATFHTQLLASPSSIYFLVPHFCPSGSILCQLSAQSAERFSGVTGPLHDDWDDKLTCDVFDSEATYLA